LFGTPFHREMVTKYKRTHFKKRKVSIRRKTKTVDGVKQNKTNKIEPN